jgi:threonyl-tRNA synthetase
LQQALVEAGVRVEVDDRDATLAARVRDAEVRKVPCVAVIGRREVQSRAVSVRGGPSGLELGRFVERLAAADAQRLAKVDL